jgi:hypothetical protein
MDVGERGARSWEAISSHLLCAGHDEGSPWNPKVGWPLSSAIAHLCNIARSQIDQPGLTQNGDESASVLPLGQS